MSINFEALDLRAFLAVTEAGSFRAAADALALSQPALSRRIQRLEGLVGGPLLERTTRRVAPTALGRELMPLVRRLLDEADTGLFGLRGAAGRGARVTLACVPTAAFYFLPAVIARFTAQLPEVRFRILDLSATEGLDAVSRGEADFGINFLGASDAALSFDPLLEDPFVLACRRDHALATRRRLSWKDLEGETLIGVSRASGNRLILEAALMKSKVRLSFHFEVNHLTTSLGLVERGLGVSVLPKLATPPPGHPVIVTRSIGEPEIKRTIGIVERRAARLSPAAQRFCDMLVATWQR